MKKTGITLLLLAVQIIAAQNMPFSIGEKLEYTAQFNVLPVGDAQLKVEGGDTIAGIPTIHISYQARTGDMADRIFRIRDQIDIWFGLDDLRTYRVKKDINEGKYRKRSTINIDYVNLIAVTNRDTLSITDDIRDPYSLFYYLRTLQLTGGQTLNLTTFDNKKFTSFQVRVKDNQKVKVPAGKFSCLVVKPFHRQKTLLSRQSREV